ncbi:S-glutathionyl-(chloro)hydroquinone reductase [Gonapodya sp. JEL0774]|nr:S-glutathionyl-(chloro)hydroquinone reductase [Gonapodya sp. JEL0774]
MASSKDTPAAETAKQDLPAIFKWSNQSDGVFRRQVSSFRSHIARDPAAQFQPEAGRYHLYVSWACPWAHRTLIVRSLKKLDSLIDVSVVDWLLTEKGWRFFPETPNATVDHINGAQYIREVYFKAEPEYKGRFTVPVLWDKQTQTIVNNESSEIIRMFNTEFNDLIPADAPKAAKDLDLYPAELRQEIDELNAWVYDGFNNGVYKSGFATTQPAYEAAAVVVFQSLDRLEKILETKEFLCGPGKGVFTEADVRCWTTVVRFDPVYHTHFKCNLRTISKDYPNVLRWARRIFQMEGVAQTVDMVHIKNHYFQSHININPTRIVPINNGPNLAAPIIKPGTVGAGPTA